MGLPPRTTPSTPPLSLTLIKISQDCLAKGQEVGALIPQFLIPIGHGLFLGALAPPNIWTAFAHRMGGLLRLY